jgi:hypothetical protein
MNTTHLTRRTGPVVAILVGTALAVASVPVAHSSEFRQFLRTGPDIALTAMSGNLRQAVEADRGRAPSSAGPSIPNLRQAIEADSGQAAAPTPNLRQAVEADRRQAAAQAAPPTSNLRQAVEADRGPALRTTDVNLRQLMESDR